MSYRNERVQSRFIIQQGLVHHDLIFLGANDYVILGDAFGMTGGCVGDGHLNIKMSSLLLPSAHFLAEVGHGNVNNISSVCRITLDRFKVLLKGGTFQAEVVNNFASHRFTKRILCSGVDGQILILQKNILGCLDYNLKQWQNIIRNLDGCLHKLSQLGQE